MSKEGRQKGKSSKMVELMPGQQDGSDVKYTLTSQIIHNIFTEFPSGKYIFNFLRIYILYMYNLILIFISSFIVKRAYDTNVPDRVCY